MEHIRQRILSDLQSKDYLTKLYPHQQKAYLEIALEFAAGHTGVGCQAVTGFGKSILARAMARSAYEKLIANYPTDSRKKILWIGENDHIIRNGLEHCLKVGIPEHDIGVIKAYRSSSEFKFDANRRVQIASIQTLNASWEDWKLRGILGCMQFQLIIIDEFHHCHNASQQYRGIKTYYPNVRRLGLSATPYDKSGFSDYFTSLVVTQSQRELAHMGYQPYWKPFGRKAPKDRSELATNADGEYTQKAADEATDPIIAGDILECWFEHVGSKYGRVPTILFASSVAKSKAFAEEINNANLIIDNKQVRAVHIDGAMKPNQLRKALGEFASGEATYLCNCAKVTEGFDLSTVAESLGVPLASVGCVQDVSFVKSIKRHKQKIGRARGIMVDGVLTAFYLDHVDACTEHYSPDTPFQWTLDGKPKPPKGEPPQKLCPPEDKGCGRWINRFMTQCPHCGYNRFPIQLEPELDEEDLHDRNAQLVEIEFDNLQHFTALLDCQRTEGWAIGEFIKYSPTYEEMLQACKLADVDCSQALQRWVEGQRIKLQDWQWLPELSKVLEILTKLSELSEQKAWKKAKAIKPLHTYRQWVRLIGRMPTMQELIEIQKACKFSDKWAWSENRQQISRRGA